MIKIPNFETHFLVGGFTCALTYLYLNKIKNDTVDGLELAGVFLVGGAVASLPDVIDPPNNAFHRSIGHSVIGASGLGVLLNNTNGNDNLTDKQRSLICSLVFAYWSHLLLDAQTPAGLPLVN